MLASNLALVLGALVATSSAKTCQNITIPVKVETRTGTFDIGGNPVTNLDATEFAQNLAQQGRNYTEVALTGYKTVSDTYNLAATYCKPSAKKFASLKNPTLQVLTHGIGFDRSYWDLSFANYNYSYVDVATDKYGYSTLAYDRLGIGMSDHAKTPQETVDTFQAPLEIAALRTLTIMLRNGKVPKVSTAFKKVLHVGHSFGSGQTYALTAMYPGISDGIAMTGFSLNTTFIGDFIAGANFQQAALEPSKRLSSEYIPGYFVNSNIGTLQFLFLLPGYFNPDIEVFGNQGRQPVTAGELLTQGSAPMSSKFAGPAMVITGSNDLPFCGGNCLATGGTGANIPEITLKPAFPKAKTFEAYIQPDTGHGINFHYNATAAYGVIQKFFDAQGLKST